MWLYIYMQYSKEQPWFKVCYQSYLFEIIKAKGEPAGAIGAKAAWKQRSEVDQAGARILVNCLLPTAYWLKRGL